MKLIRISLSMKQWLCSFVCIALLQSCGVSEAIDDIEEQERLADYTDWLDELRVSVATSELWDMEVWFPEEAYNRHLTFLLSERQDAEGGFEIPVDDQVHPLKGLKSNTPYYYCLRSDSIPVKSVIRTFNTPYFSPISIGLVEEENRIKCEIYTDIPQESILEKGFYSEEDNNWKYVVEGDDFSIPRDSMLYSIAAYLVMEEGMAYSQMWNGYAPSFGPITEIYQGNALLLQCEIRGALYGEFEVVLSDGRKRNLGADLVKRTSKNSCLLTLDPPHYDVPVKIQCTYRDYCSEEYTLQPVEE